MFDYDVVRLAKTYYDAFGRYIKERQPDIVGHFDLITKFDEIDISRFLNNREYKELSCKYMRKIAECDVIFEVNTGAISRGFRKDPYPHSDLLHIIRKHNGKVILASDSHDAGTLDSHFDATEEILRDIGFEYVYVLYNGEFRKRSIKNDKCTLLGF